MGVRYEAAKRGYAARFAAGRELELWENAAIGTAAGGVAAAVTTPLDVVRVFVRVYI